MSIATSLRSGFAFANSLRQPFCTALFALILTLSAPFSPLTAQPGCVLLCKDSVKISMFDGCVRQINGDFVAGTLTCIGPKTVEIWDEFNQKLPNDKVYSQHVGKLLTVKVTSNYWGSTCWGSIVPTDLRAPKILPKDTVISCLVSPDPTTIGFPPVVDECSAIGSLTFTDTITEFGCQTEDFTGPFRPVCWTFCKPLNDGGIDTTGVPETIILHGASNSMITTMAKYRTSMKIRLPAPGYVMFDWQLWGTGNPSTVDAAFFTIGDTVCYKMSGTDTLSGTYMSDPLPAGAWISIEIVSNGDHLFNSLKIFNFKFVTTAVASIRRTWTATDIWGNHSTAVQYITLNRASVGNIIWPKNRDDLQLPSLECGTILTDLVVGMPIIDDDGNPQTTNDQHPANVNSPWCSVAITKTDQIFPLCGGSYALARAWTAIDDCSAGVATHTQLIKVLDKTPPVIACPANVTVSTSQVNCKAEITLTQPTATDACSAFSTTATASFGSGFNLIPNVPTGDHTILYAATDACGNSATCSSILSVKDLVEPSMICQQNVVASISQNGEATVFPSSFDEATYDNCCLNLLEIKRLDIPGQSFGLQILFNAADVSPLPKPVELRATDCAGNQNSCVVNLVIQDLLPPILTCPTDATTDCQQDFGDFSQFGNAVVSDNSAVASLDFVFLDNTNQCGIGQISRSWLATDIWGNTSFCAQTITVLNLLPWNGAAQIQWPADYLTTACTAPDDLEPANLPTANGFPIYGGVAGCELPAVAHEDEFFQFQGGVCLKILRKWTVIDWCNYAPGSPSGIWSHTQIIQVMDNVAPNFIDPPLNLELEILGNTCSATVILPQIDVQDCQPNTSLNVSSPFGQGFGPFPNIGQGSFLITYSASDGCGNQNTWSVNLEIIDKKAPQAVCLNGLSTNLGAGGTVSLAANFFNQSSSDNCTAASQLIFSFSQNVANQSVTFDCDDLGGQPIELWVTDLAGNQSSCSTYILVEDNNNECGTPPVPLASISGQILTEIGQPVGEAMVSCTGQSAQVTAPGGSFLFGNLPTAQGYELAVSKNINPLNGITSFDLNRIQDHLSGASPITSPWKLIAADASNNEAVDQPDLDLVTDLLLQNIPTFPNNESWRFVPAAFGFVNPQNPWPFDESIFVPNLMTNLAGQNFIGMKIGDVNNTANPLSATGETEDRSPGDTLHLHTPEMDFLAGETFSLPVSAHDPDLFESCQLTLEFDQQKLEFLGFLNSNQSKFGLSKLSEGAINHLWLHPKTGSLGADTPIFNLLFKAKTDGQVQSSMQVSSKFVERAAFKTGMTEEQKMEVVLEFERPIEPPPPPVGTADLNANSLIFNGIHPNPMSREAVVEYILPVGGEARLTIFDALGQLVFEKKMLAKSGLNLMPIQFSENSTASGLLFFKLETAGGVATGRVLKMED